MSIVSKVSKSVIGKVKNKKKKAAQYNLTCVNECVRVSYQYIKMSGSLEPLGTTLLRKNLEFPTVIRILEI